MNLFKKVYFIFFLFPIICNSQILNIENKNLFDKIDSNRVLKFSSEFGFQYLENTKSLLNFQNSNHIQFKIKKSDLSFITDLQILKSGKETLLNSNILYLKWNYQLSNYLFIESIVQHSINKVYFINKRDLFSLGFKEKIFQDSVFKITTGNSLFIEKISIRDTLNYRLNFYIDSKINVSKSKFGLGFYYQPEVRNFLDYRFLINSDFEIPISKKVSLKTQIIWIKDLEKFESFNFTQKIKLVL